MKGVIFRLPNVNGRKPFELGVPEWSELHRAIIGEYLGRLACDSYEAGRFLASAVAVSKASMEPSDGFRALLEKLGFVGSRRDKRCVDVWVDQLRRGYTWFQQHPRWPEA